MVSILLICTLISSHSTFLYAFKPISFNNGMALWAYKHLINFIVWTGCFISFSPSHYNPFSCLLFFLHISSLSPLPPSLPPPPPTAYITRCEVHSVYKRLSDKRYVYMILVEWSDGTQYTVRRTYGDFFSFQTKVCVARVQGAKLQCTVLPRITACPPPSNQ